MFDHVVESGRELTDFVTRGDVDRAIEPARLDGAGAVQEPADRPCDAGADEKREYQSENARKQGQDYGNDDSSLLVTHRRQGIAANLRQHVRADIFDPLVEFVAQRVGPGQACPGFRDIPGIEH